MEEEIKIQPEQQELPVPSGEQEAKLSETGDVASFEENVYFRPSIHRLRIFLMFFMCIELFGFPTEYGVLVQQCCGFVPITFFILSGYLVLRETNDRSARILRTIKRTAIVFLMLTVVYLISNFLYYRSLEIDIFSAFASKRLWFNFLVLNVWPFDIGSSLWYVQSLLYAYVIIYFMDKWKLLKYDLLLAVALILLTILTGELAGVLPWNIAGYTYLPGNFFTRALPYVLLGGFFHRNVQLTNIIRPIQCLIGIVAGTALVLLELFFLDYLGKPGYYGHMIGMPIVAISLCMLAIMQKGFPDFEDQPILPRQYVSCIYYLCPLVSIGLLFLMSFLDEETFTEIIGFLGIFTFLICFCLVYLLSYLVRRVDFGKQDKQSLRRASK